MQLQITEEEIMNLLKKVNELEKNNVILTALAIVLGIILFVVGMAISVEYFTRSFTENK